MIEKKQFNILMRSLATCSHWENKRFYRKIKNSKFNNSDISPLFNQAIIILGKQEKLDRALSVFEILEEKNLLNLSNYITMLRAIKKQEVPDVIAAKNIVKMAKQSFYQLDIKLYVQYLCVLANSKIPNVDWAEKILIETLSSTSKQKGVYPSSSIYNLFFKCISKSEKPNYEKARDWYRKMEVKPDVIVYTTLITILGRIPKPNFLEALTLYKEMIAHKIKPDSLLYSALFTVLARSKHPQVPSISDKLYQKALSECGYHPNIFKGILDIYAMSNQRNAIDCKGSEILKEGIEKGCIFLPKNTQYFHENMHELSYGEVYFYVKELFTHISLQNKNDTCTFNLIPGKRTHSYNQKEYGIEYALKQVIEDSEKFLPISICCEKEKCNPGVMNITVSKKMDKQCEFSIKPRSDSFNLPDDIDTHQNEENLSSSIKHFVFSLKKLNSTLLFFSKKEENEEDLVLENLQRGVNPLQRNIFRLPH